MVCASAGATAIILTGSNIKGALNNPKALFKASCYTVDRLGLDTLNGIVDMSLEAEACGCQIQYRERNLPDVVTHPAKTLDDISNLVVPDPYRDGRMPIFLNAMRLMAKNYTMMKVGFISGPFTLAMLLAGSGIYVDIRRQPQKVHSLLSYCQKVVVRYGQALINAGADMIVIAEPMGSQLSPQGYEEFSHTYVKQIISSFGKPCCLHICGKAGHIAQKMAESGAVLLSLDEVDVQSLARSISESVVLMGNISPTKLRINSVGQIADATRALKESIRHRKTFIIGPGCDLAPETPLENIQAFVKVAKS